MMHTEASFLTWYPKLRRKDNWEQMGTYDINMTEWGGEHIEVAVRIDDMRFCPIWDCHTWILWTLMSSLKRCNFEVMSLGPDTMPDVIADLAVWWPNPYCTLFTRGDLMVGFNGWDAEKNEKSGFDVVKTWRVNWCWLVNGKFWETVQSYPSFSKARTLEAPIDSNMWKDSKRLFDLRTKIKKQWLCQPSAGYGLDHLLREFGWTSEVEKSPPHLDTANLWRCEVSSIPHSWWQQFTNSWHTTQLQGELSHNIWWDLIWLVISSDFNESWGMGHVFRAWASQLLQKGVGPNGMP